MDTREGQQERRRQRQQARDKPKESEDFLLRMTKLTEALMDNPDMRELLWWLLDQEKCDQECFTGNSRTYFLEGVKAAARQRQQFLKEVSMPLYHKMEMENSSLINK